jgi:hypothetical protein
MSRPYRCAVGALAQTDVSEEVGSPHDSSGSPSDDRGASPICWLRGGPLGHIGIIAVIPHAIPSPRFASGQPYLLPSALWAKGKPSGA